MTTRTKTLAASVLVGAGFFWLYRQVIVTLVAAWWTDGNYSHGFLIVPIAAYLAWERRARFAAAPLRPSVAGLILVVGSLLVLAGGVLGAELFGTRISIVGTLAGVVLFLFGWARLRVMAFPLAFLLLMIPLPAIVFNQVTFPLQLLASRVGEFALGSVDIPVLREGNVLVLANTTLEVAEACSGIRSLVSLLTLGIVYGYFADQRTWVRAVIACSTIPVAILTNGARVAGTGVAVHFVGPTAADGFIHESAGWAVFIMAFFLVVGVHRLILWVLPLRSTPTPIVATAS